MPARGPVRGGSRTGGTRARRPRDDQAETANATPITIRDVIEGVSLVIAPASLLTALAFWFGWTLTNSRSAYFGIDHSMLGYSTTDYLLRSADAAFVPLAVLLLVLLVAVAGHRLIKQCLGTSGRPVRWSRIAGSALAVGLAMLGLGVWGLFRPIPFATHYLLPPLILGSATAITAYAVWLLHAVLSPGPVTVWDRLFGIFAGMLTLLSLFWAASLYAAALGRGRAEVLASGLDRRPGVTILSRDDLSISGPGVVAEQVNKPQSIYHFRYSGLRLLIQSGGRLFLLPAGWTRGEGAVIVLEPAEGIRLELTPGGAR